VRGSLTKEEAVGTLREFFSNNYNSEESGETIESPFLQGKYDTWGEAQLHAKIRCHRDVGEKFYADMYEKYVND
jgi:hypothetical protein